MINDKYIVKKCTIIGLLICTMTTLSFLLATKMLNNKNNNEKENVVEPTPSSTPTSTPESIPTLYDLDITKCINCTFRNMDGQNIYDGSNMIFSDVADIKINSDNKKMVSFSIDDKYHQYGDSDTISFNLTFNKNVKKVFEGISHTFEIGGTVYFFLLEDGTVEYLEFSNIYNKNYVNKVVEGVSGVVELKNIYYEAKVNSAGGGTMVLAFRQDGTFYNLYDSIEFTDINARN